MLILSRKVGEEIVFSRRDGSWLATVTVTRVKGDTVRIGIMAPRQMRVLRGELEPTELAPTLPEEEADAERTCDQKTEAAA